MKKRITVVGSANVDMIMELPRLPKRGESVGGGVFSQVFGGKGANQALAARRSGGNVAAVLSLGRDPAGEAILDGFRAEGVDVGHTALRPGVPCGTAMIYVEKGGENCIGVAMGANALLSVEQVDAAEELIAGSGMVALQMEIPDESIARVLELAGRHGTEVMLNYAPCRESAVAVSGRIGMLVVNESEAGALAGLDVVGVGEAEKAALALSRRGPPVVIVTLGAQGAVVCDRGECFHQPAFAVAAVDATAAGDVFCGSLATALVENRGLPDAVRFASAAGAVCAGRMGAQPSIPAREDIDAFLAAQ